MNKYITKNQSGFTLLEVLIAMFIFSIGILGVNAMQLTSIQGNSKANRITQAGNVAADRIETFLSLDYDDPILDDDGAQMPPVINGVAGLDDVTAVTADGNMLSADGNYQIYWNVAADYPITDTKTIRVIVVPPGNGSNVVMDIVKARPI